MSDVPPPPPTPPQPPVPPVPPPPPGPPVPPQPGPGGSGYAAAGGGEPPLDQPFYGASFGASVRRFFRKYATFSGRASRGEFWWWTLLYVIIAIVFSFFTGHFKPTGGMTASANVFTTIESLWNLAIVVPFLALSSRRLHDTNRSGWWVLLWLIPIVGTIILIVWWAGRPKPEGARFDR